MRLRNASNLVSTEDLAHLTQFVVNHCDNADLAQVFIGDTKQVDGAGEPTCGGLASQDGDKYQVRIGINDEASYPRRQRLNLLTPEVRFDRWHDEYVMVLAHELRHIDQFALGAFRQGEELEAEVDAETFAAAVLGAWQKLLEGLDTKPANL